MCRVRLSRSPFHSWRQQRSQNQNCQRSSKALLQPVVRGWPPLEFSCEGCDALIASGDPHLARDLWLKCPTVPVAKLLQSSHSLKWLGQPCCDPMALQYESCRGLE